MSDLTRYQRFQRRQDNVNQVVSAKDINQVQETLEQVQKAVFGVKDEDFLQKALFVLEHNPLVNSMWIDLMDNTDKIDHAAVRELTFFTEERGWAFPEGSKQLEGMLVSRPFTVQTRSQIKSVMLMVSHHLPQGATATYEVTADNKHWHPINPAVDGVIELPNWHGYQLRVRCTLRRSDDTVQPIIYGWAMLYHDPKVGIVELDDDDWVAPPTPGNPDLTVPVTIRHSDLLDIGRDDHHPEQHAHDGIDGSGRISHTVLLDIGPDDHHPKVHRHGEDGIPPVDLSTDVAGTLDVKHMPLAFFLDEQGDTVIVRDPQTDQVVRVESPDSITEMEYDSEGRLTTARTTHRLPPIAGMQTVTTLDYSYDPPLINTVILDAQGNPWAPTPPTPAPTP